VSAFFLLLIAVVNFFIFLDVFKRFQAARKGRYRRKTHCKTCWAAEVCCPPSAIRFRVRRPQLAHVSDRPVVRIGVDTATEVAVLGMAATQAAKQMPIWSIMVFPLLFTAGMCLLDTTDGVVMLGAYGWAFVKPVRKLFYNMTITFVSFVIALLIGSIEALGVIASKLHLDTGIWPASTCSATATTRPRWAIASSA